METLLILILNCETFSKKWRNIHKKKIKPFNKTKWIPVKPVSFPKLTQSRLVPFQMHRQCELDYVSFGKKMLTFKVAISWCVWVRAGWLWWDWWCMLVSGSVGVLMVFEWKAMGVWMDVLGWGWVCVLGADELISKFWTSCIFYKLILTTSVTIVCITQFSQKVDCEFWSEFEKKNQKQKQNQNQTKQNKTNK